jgi:H+/Cl- antiporter ClcA
MVGLFVLFLVLGLVAGIVGPFLIEYFGAHK